MINDSESSINDNYSMEPRFNKDLGTMKITLFRYIRFLVISG